MQTAHNQLIIEQFTKQAIPFAQVAEHARRDNLQLLVEMAKTTAADTVLDVACGPGLVACAFAQIAQQVTGIDLTPAMLEQAQQRQQALQLTNLVWQVGDVERLPYPDNHFSIVVTRFSFHHLIELQKVLREMLRVCQTGGVVMVVDVALAEEKVAAYNQMEKLRDPSHTRALTVAELSTMVVESGLQQIESTWFTVEMELETALRASFPNEGDVEKLRAMFWQDVGRDSLGVNVRQVGEQIHFAYPILVLAGRKG